MKNILPFLSLALVWMVATATAASAQSTATSATLLQGAWQMQESPGDEVVIFTDNYFSYANYDKGERQFRVTFGGTYKTENGQIATHLEFHSGDSTQVGQSLSYPFTLSNDVLTITVDGENTTWNRLDNGTAPLAGNWRITHRLQDGKMQAIHQSGGRKTVKILSGTRFQWAAINTDTKEFFGTGGGTYTFQNGKYTETIEFFSRDNSRVGASLTFDGKVEKDGWHHSGLSSRGDKIYEVWNKTK
jgi:hypothetical protein